MNQGISSILSVRRFQSQGASPYKIPIVSANQCCAQLSQGRTNADHCIEQCPRFLSLLADISCGCLELCFEELLLARNALELLFVML